MKLKAILAVFFFIEPKVIKHRFIHKVASQIKLDCDFGKAMADFIFLLM
jgi:hypothetical protein